MATLISKVVRSGAARQGDDWHASSAHNSNPIHRNSHIVISGGPSLPNSGNTFLDTRGKGLDARTGSSDSDIRLAKYPGQHGIVKTMETRVVVGSGEDSHSDKS
jgi:hypothetical protein